MTASSRKPALSLKYKEGTEVPISAEIDLLVSLLPRIVETMGYVSSTAEMENKLCDFALDKSVEEAEDFSSK